MKLLLLFLLMYILYQNYTVRILQLYIRLLLLGGYNKVKISS